MLPLSKEHARPGHAGIVDHSLGFIDTRLKKKEKEKKGRERNNNYYFFKTLYKCTMPNPTLQQAARITTQLSSPSCSTRAIWKSLTLNEECLRVFWREKSQENGPLAKYKTDWAKNKRGDRKGESNDSPVIPDRGRCQISPASLWGHRNKNHTRATFFAPAHIIYVCCTSTQKYKHDAFPCQCILCIAAAELKNT